VIALLLSSLAFAGDPYRCEAVWSGPAVEGCGLSGRWAATGTGKNQENAREAAAQRLGDAVQAAADGRAIKARGTPAEQITDRERSTCMPTVLVEAQFFCHADPELSQTRLCFADFPDSNCFRGASLDLEGPAWKVMEEGRVKICAESDAAMAAQNVALQRRSECMAKCLSTATVKCAAADPDQR
jgi:hypothetical protein